MDYQISEAEINRLESVRDQLGLITMLLSSGSTGDELQITGLQLQAFIDSQQCAVAGVLEGAHECERPYGQSDMSNASISPELLMRLMDAASGSLSEPAALMSLWDELMDVGVHNSLYRDVMQHFLHVMRRKGHVLHIAVLDGAAKSEFIKKAAPEQSPRKRSTPSVATRRKRAGLEAAAIV